MFPLNLPNALTVVRILLVPVAAVLALIAASDSDAAWVMALVYAMVGVTVLSGADYFLNFRRKLDEASRSPETSRA